MPINENDRDGSTREKAFIVRSYSDFIEALNKEYAWAPQCKYIEFDPNAENKIIDANDIDLEDYDGFNFVLDGPRFNYPSRTLYIYGNNWTLKNFWTYKNTLFNINIVNNYSETVHIFRLNILNAFIGTTGNGSFIDTGSIGFNNKLFCYDCKFSMLFACSSIGSVIYSNKFLPENSINFLRCSFNIRSVSNDFVFISFPDVTDPSSENIGYRLINCNLRLIIERCSYSIFRLCNYSSSAKPEIKYCKFTGKIVITHSNSNFKDYFYSNNTLNSYEKIINNLYQLSFKRTISATPVLNIFDKLSGMYNSEFIEGFSVTNVANMHIAPGHKPPSTASNPDDYLLNTQYLLDNLFPVMSEDAEDPKEV